MANKIKWSSTGSYTTAISGGASSPTLKNLAAGSQKIGNAIDNQAAGARDLLADFDLKVRFTSSPTAGSYVELYFILAVDGTNYQDGDDTVAPPLSSFVGVFEVRAVTTQQRIALREIVLPPNKFKALIKNAA